MNRGVNVRAGRGLALVESSISKILGDGGSQGLVVLRFLIYQPGEPEEYERAKEGRPPIVPG